MKICIDPGHGGSDPGAVGYKPFRLEEKTVNLEIANLLAELLLTKGYEVTQTRIDDRKVSLNERAEIANHSKVDLFVSVHVNDTKNGEESAEGIEVYHYPKSQHSIEFARMILTSLMKAFPDHKNRGVKSANLAVLRLTKMPAVLVECEFIRNPMKLCFLARPETKELYASALAEGIESTVKALGLISPLLPKRANVVKCC